MTTYLYISIEKGTYRFPNRLSLCCGSFYFFSIFFFNHEPLLYEGPINSMTNAYHCTRTSCWVFLKVLYLRHVIPSCTHWKYMIHMKLIFHVSSCDSHCLGFLPRTVWNSVVLIIFVEQSRGKGSLVLLFYSKNTQALTVMCFLPPRMERRVPPRVGGMGVALSQSIMNPLLLWRCEGSRGEP